MPSLELLSKSVQNKPAAAAAPHLHIVAVAAQGALGVAQAAVLGVAQLPDQHGLVPARAGRGEAAGRSRAGGCPAATAIQRHPRLRGSHWPWLGALSGFRGTARQPGSPRAGQQGLAGGVQGGRDGGDLRAGSVSWRCTAAAGRPQRLPCPPEALACKSCRSRQAAASPPAPSCCLSSPSPGGLQAAGAQAERRG